MDNPNQNLVTEEKQETAEEFIRNNYLSYVYYLASPMFADFADLSSKERNEFMEKFKNMPANLKSFLGAVETAETIFTTAKKYELKDEQIEKTSASIRQLLLGEIFIKDVPGALAVKTALDEKIATNIINEIIAKSFGPIADDIKRIQRIKFMDRIKTLQKDTQTGQPPIQAEGPPSMRPPVSPPISSASPVPPTQDQIKQPEYISRSTPLKEAEGMNPDKISAEEELKKALNDISKIDLKFKSE